MIPLICTIRIARPGGRRFRIWIPLFLLWPFVIVLFVVTELFVILACVVLLFIWPRDAVKLALALPGVLYLLFQTAGLMVDIAEPDRPQVLFQLS